MYMILGIEHFGQYFIQKCYSFGFLSLNFILKQ